MNMSKISVGLIGYGYWGPNLARNFRASDLYELSYIADLSEKRRSAAQKENHGNRVISDYREILEDSKIELVAVATPTSTHYAIAREILSRGKHVFAEKPLTNSIAQAEELVNLSEKAGTILAVDHPFLFSSAVRKLKSIIDSGDIGDIFVIDSERLNLGLIQKDTNVFWDLAVHDVSIIDYLLGGVLPHRLMADAERYTQQDQHEFGAVSLRYPGKQIANIRVSWLSPIKARRMMIVGSKKMAYFDDIHPDEKIKIIDKGVEYDSDKDKALFPVYRWGDALLPRLDNTESLRREVDELYATIRTGTPFPSSGRDALRILKVLSAIDESLISRMEVAIV